MYLDGVVELSSQILPQLVIAGDPVQDKVRYVGGTVASEERSAKVGHAGLGVVLHQFGAGGHTRASGWGDSVKCEWWRKKNRKNCRKDISSL